MRKVIIVLIIMELAVIGLILALRKPKIPVYHQPVATSNPSLASSMKIISSAFEPNQSIPAKYTCDGANVNPPLDFLEVPKEAKTLALIVDDPDAPKGDWVHWLVWNINPAINQIAENSVPEEVVEGTTDFGKSGYGGPCPPSGAHRYFFKLYALDVKLNLPSYSTKKDLLQAMNGHIIGQTELVGVYQRKK